MRLLGVALLLLVACGDNIVPGAPRLVITAGDGLRTTENGGTAMFTVGFDVPPTTATTVSLTSTNRSEGRVSPETIQLRPDDEGGVLVTVIGVDDIEIDGNQAYKIHVNAGVMGERDVDVTNEDDDGNVGVAMVTPTSGTTTETGGTATFQVVLTTEPNSNVSIPLSSSNANEGSLSTTAIVFSQTNWNVAQTITVTGVDDDIDDGDVAYNAVLGPVTSGDPRFSGMNPADVALTNTDNDTRGFMLTTVNAPTNESGTQSTFTFALTSEPLADVTIALASADTTEGNVSPTSITFTSADWDTARTVTITGVDDVIDDGDITYSIVLDPATSLDTGYNTMDPPDRSATNIDDDGAAIDIVAPANGLMTNEGGATDSFTIVLRTQPTAAVTIPITSNDPTEGVTAIGSVTFTTLDWNLPQQIVVTGQDDTIVDGAVQYTILVGAATSTDASYSGMDPADVPATNLDNDNAKISVFPTDGLFVSEFNDTDVFEIVLLQQPLGTVTIPLSTSDATEGTLFPISTTSVTFTTLDWNVPQEITIRGVDDNLADGNIVFSIITGAAISTDLAFSGVDAPDVTVTNFDNETANVFVQARKTIATKEDGGPSGQATFRVRLTTAPTGPVTCTLASNDLTEGQVSPQTLVFNNTNFQTVTLSGVDDAIDDGDVRYTIITFPCTSTDSDYDQRNPRDVSVLNLDND